MTKQALCVDDMEIERIKLKSILEEVGYKTETAISGKDAIEKINAGLKPDVIFMDIVMPDIDGFATCRTLTQIENSKDIPIVFVSSKSQQADKVWAQLQGGKAYVTKPYQKQEIIDILQTLS